MLHVFFKLNYTNIFIIFSKKNTSPQLSDNKRTKFKKILKIYYNLKKSFHNICLKVNLKKNIHLVVKEIFVSNKFLLLFIKI